MIRRPPRSTRTDTLFPYTTLVRSWVVGPQQEVIAGVGGGDLDALAQELVHVGPSEALEPVGEGEVGVGRHPHRSVCRRLKFGHGHRAPSCPRPASWSDGGPPLYGKPGPTVLSSSSEDRRVGTA